MNSQASGTNNVDALFQSAVASGSISKSALNAINIANVADDINNALGVSIDDVKASEVVLVTLLVDDSGSIQLAGNSQHVRDGHNLVLDSLGKTKAKDGILTMCLYLNGTLLYAYCPVDKAVRMTGNNYDPNGGTPLYNQSVVTLAAVIAKYQEFQDNGIACRTITGIITDGANATYGGKTARDVKRIVDDMLRAENHIVAGIGIDDGFTDFRKIFGEMGIRPEWILTPKNSPSEIRKAFNTLSQSASRASQGAGAFSQQAMGGFASP